MCDGVPMFANNKKAIYGKKTGSHSTAALALGIKEDEWRKFEFHFWDGTYPMDHYDSTAEKILAHIDPVLAEKHVKELVKKHFSTKEDIWKWLKNVPDQWKHIQEVESPTLKNYLFKNLTGMTPAENKKALKVQQKKVDAFVKHLPKINWFKPAPILNKRDITLKVDFSLNLFDLPKAKIEFRWLETANDWDAARDAAWDAARDAARGAARDAARGAAWDAARGAARDAAWDAAWDAARDAAWDAARDAAWDAARDAAWDAAWGAAWDAARGAEFMIVEDLPAIKKKYKSNPFTSLMELWEMGLYPVGLVNKKFVIYVPVVDGKKPVIK